MTAALSKSVEKYGRSLVIVPNKSLVVQTEADFVNLGLDVGVYFGDRKEYGKTHTICTWQSLNNLFKNTADIGEENLDEFFFEDIACVIVDEVHMAKANVLKTMLTGVFSNIPIRWGLTGTIPKAEMDRVSLLVSLGPVIGKLSASELQDRGVLAQCHVNIVQMKDNKEFTNYQSELKHLLEDEKRLDKIASLITSIADTGNTLVLVDRVNAGKELINRIDGAVFVNGSTKLTERKEEYDEVATSNDKIIIATYGIAAVGINIPRIFNLVLIEPGKSFVRVIQSIGRGIRKAEDKDFVQIWDITSTCKFAKRHLTQRKAYYKEANYPFALEKLDY
jgi:superfamily II DNA or RNA helicase